MHVLCTAPSMRYGIFSPEQRFPAGSSLCRSPCTTLLTVLLIMSWSLLLLLSCSCLKIDYDRYQLKLGGVLHKFPPCTCCVATLSMLPGDEETFAGSGYKHCMKMNLCHMHCNAIIARLLFYRTALKTQKWLLYICSPIQTVALGIGISALSRASPRLSSAPQLLLKKFTIYSCVVATWQQILTSLHCRQ